MRLSEQKVFVQEARKDLTAANAAKPFDAARIEAARDHFHASHELYESLCVERAEALEDEVRDLKRCLKELLVVGTVSGSDTYTEWAHSTDAAECFCQVCSSVAQQRKVAQWANKLLTE